MYLQIGHKIKDPQKTVTRHICDIDKVQFVKMYSIYSSTLNG